MTNVYYLTTTLGKWTNGYAAVGKKQADKIKPLVLPAQRVVQPGGREPP